MTTDYLESVLLWNLLSASLYLVQATVDHVPVVRVQDEKKSSTTGGTLKTLVEHSSA